MTAMARRAEKYTILDIKGQDLLRCLSNEEEFLPNLIKPNMEEFLQTFGCEEDPVAVLERLNCNAVITNGSKGCFVYDSKSSLPRRDHGRSGQGSGKTYLNLHTMSFTRSSRSRLAWFVFVSICTNSMSMIRAQSHSMEASTS